MTNIHLVKKARAGDEDAFCQLVEDRKESIYKIAYCYVKNQDDALDIVSEAVYKAFVSLSKLKEPKYFNTWLTRIVINAAINHLEKMKKVVLEEVTPRASATGVSQEEVVDLYTAIDKLDPKEKTIIILMYIEGFQLKEIANMLDIPLGTVKTRLNRALKTLRIQLEEV